MMMVYGQVDQEILMREVVPTDQGLEMKVEEVVEEVDEEEEEEVEEDGGMNQEDQNLEEVTPIDGRH
jgi:Mg/Co/Ni transporter MgtE